ncbi:MAG: hypothetical protein RLZZ293_463 [Pseudomonadota bacterium]|jgi:ATP-dependent DNA helicase RecG
MPNLFLLSPIPNSADIADKLAKLNLYCYWDLALHIPLRYEDLTKIYPVAQIQVGQQGMVEGKIISCEIIKRKTSQQLVVKLEDNGFVISLVFFHFFSNYRHQYVLGKIIRAYGEVKQDYYGNKTIIHPKIQAATAQTQLSESFSPVYPTTSGLANIALINLVNDFLTQNLLEETLPLGIKQRYNLLGLAEAIITLHKLTPSQYEKNEHLLALHRLKYEELIAQQLLMQRAYHNKHQLDAPSLFSTQQLIAPFLAQLPFKLTNAQLRVVDEILLDLQRPQQMNRLLQGDVGSGKTMVAAITALVALENNYQAVLMAPTEILAEQHYQKLQKMLAPLNLNIVWLAGSLTPKQKRLVAEQCANGQAQLIIGTHAIFQKNIEFAKLGVVIIDEQHRFGVEQRRSLINKGNANLFPHQLMMSATPIPRSLAMSYYADLDSSIIDELPPGRTPIKTMLIRSNRRQEIIEFVKNKASLGCQIYWVCPLIEESEKLELENAQHTYEELTTQLAPIQVGLVHGKLKPKDKAEIMTNFASNQIQVLVATSVIEVGVDVPNASIMVIEHSERMGLAQLHQLRGRVGRGAVESQCVLLFEGDNLSQIAKQRLKVISSSNDGFEIARQDLLIRGPGELLGQRQSGMPPLRFADLERDIQILHDARLIAKELSHSYPKVSQYILDLWFYNKQVYSTV